jgi:alanyl-tRNA synthetase
MASLNDIRSTFLDYFRRNGHEVVDSSPLVPRNDPTLMFTNSGMVQFKNLFTGVEHRDYVRATTSAEMRARGRQAQRSRQRGLHRAAPHVLRDAGEFLLRRLLQGSEAIPFAWELLTKDFGIDKSKLLVTVYHTDDEAARSGRRSRACRTTDHPHPTDDNFWMMGPTGPCGPCTEIFYDHGDHIWGGPPGSPDEDGDRFIEIWNLVFMQNEQFEDGSARRSTCSRSTPAWGWNGSARCCRASTTITTPT